MSDAIVSAFWIIVVQVVLLIGIVGYLCALWEEHQAWKHRTARTPEPSTEPDGPYAGLGDEGETLAEWTARHRVRLPPDP